MLDSITFYSEIDDNEAECGGVPHVAPDVRHVLAWVVSSDVQVLGEKLVV